MLLNLGINLVIGPGLGINLIFGVSGIMKPKELKYKKWNRKTGYWPVEANRFKMKCKNKYVNISYSWKLSYVWPGPFIYRCSKSWSGSNFIKDE